MLQDLPAYVRMFARVYPFHTFYDALVFKSTLLKISSKMYLTDYRLIISIATHNLVRIAHHHNAYCLEDDACQLI